MPVLDMAVPGAAVRRAIERAGSPGRIRFTERQLYYELCRVLLPAHRIGRRPGFTVTAPVSYQRFQRLLARHQPGRVPGLLVGSRPVAPAPPAEVFDYGLPRVLVCQHRSIADMLLANGLHMESACPVFAAADLPWDARLTDAVRAGDGRVYVLHDSGPAGATSVESVGRHASGLPVTSLGLRPAHAAALHLTRLRGGVVEVAAVNPARLLRTVHRLVRGQVRRRPTDSRPAQLAGSRLRRLAGVGFLTWPEGAA